MFGYVAGAMRRADLVIRNREDSLLFVVEGSSLPNLHYKYGQLMYYYGLMCGESPVSADKGMKLLHTCLI